MAKQHKPGVLNSNAHGAKIQHTSGDWLNRIHIVVLSCILPKHCCSPQLHLHLHRFPHQQQMDWHTTFSLCFFLLLQDHFFILLGTEATVTYPSAFGAKVQLTWFCPPLFSSQEQMSGWSRAWITAGLFQRFSIKPQIRRCIFCAVFVDSNPCCPPVDGGNTVPSFSAAGLRLNRLLNELSD